MPFALCPKLVGLDGIEPSTSRLSGVRSNRTELQAPVVSDLIQRISDCSRMNFSETHYLKPKIRLSLSWLQIERTILDLSKLNSDSQSRGVLFLSVRLFFNKNRP